MPVSVPAQTYGNVCRVGGMGYYSVSTCWWRDILRWCLASRGLGVDLGFDNFVWVTRLCRARVCKAEVGSTGCDAPRVAVHSNLRYTTCCGTRSFTVRSMLRYILWRCATCCRTPRVAEHHVMLDTTCCIGFVEDLLHGKMRACGVLGQCLLCRVVLPT